MNKFLILLGLLTIPRLSHSQFFDTIRVGTGVTTLIEFKGNAAIRQLDISGSASSNIQQAKNKDLYYAVMDSTANIIKLKAVKAFTGKIILTVFSDTTVQYLVKYDVDPSRTYYSYNLGRGTFEDGGKTIKTNAKTNTTKTVGNNVKGQSGKQLSDVDQHFINLANGEGKEGEDADDSRSYLEKNATKLMNPRDKLFTAMRSKNQNITLGDIRAGVRIYLQKFYKSRELTYFMFKIANYSMSDFQLEDFAINKVESNSDSKLTIIHEESAYNLLKRYEKVDFIAIGENIEITAGGKLVFTFKGKGDKGKGFTFTMEMKEFEKRQPL
jgi:hypothetical protein